MKNKAKKFLMINPAEISPEGVSVRVHPPLGAVSVISVLSKCGWDVKLLDVTAEAKIKAISDRKYTPYTPYTVSYERNGIRREAVFWRNGLSDDEIINVVERYSPSIIGISCITLVTRSEVRRMSSILKKRFPQIPIILGGHEPTVHYDTMLRGNDLEKVDGVDCIVLGPGQPVIEEIANYLIGDITPDSFVNTVVVENFRGKLVLKVKDVKLFDPNDYPLIDYSYLPDAFHDNVRMDIYSYVGITHAGDLIEMFNMGKERFKYLPLFTSFGCGYHCSFCDNTEAFPHKRYSPENVVRMVDSYRRKFGDPDYVDIMDNNFGGMGSEDYGMALDVLEALRPFNYRIDFSNGLTFTSMIREDFKLLRRASECGQIMHIAFPIESLTPRVLAMIRKPHTLDMVKRTLVWVKDYFSDRLTKGLFNREAFIIIGFPGTRGYPAETTDEIEGAISTLVSFFKEGMLDQAIPLTLSPVTLEYRKMWRNIHPNDPFELSMFSQSTGIWPYGDELLFSFRNRIKQINTEYNHKITRNM